MDKKERMEQQAAAWPVVVAAPDCEIGETNSKVIDRNNLLTGDMIERNLHCRRSAFDLKDGNVELRVIKF